MTRTKGATQMTATTTLIGLFGLGLLTAVLALGEAVYDRRSRYGTRQRRTARREPRRPF